MNWLLTPQVKKVVDGYYLNHDNLMIATPSERRKLIFYFIASQTPEKITQADFDRFQEEKSIDINVRSGLFTSIFTGYVALALSDCKLLTTRISARPVLNLAIIGGAGLFAASFSYNLSQVLFEPLFVSKNEVIEELAEKYKFSVFDFAMAKKESHLKALRDELASDSTNVWHF